MKFLRTKAAQSYALREARRNAFEEAFSVLRKRGDTQDLSVETIERVIALLTRERDLSAGEVVARAFEEVFTPLRIERSFNNKALDREMRR